MIQVLSLLFLLHRFIVHSCIKFIVNCELAVKENKAALKREVSVIRERLRSLEADSGFLKHTAMTLQKGEKGAELLTEIAQHLRKLRHSETPEDMNTTEDINTSVS